MGSLDYYFVLIVCYLKGHCFFLYFLLDITKRTDETELRLQIILLQYWKVKNGLFDLKEGGGARSSPHE